MGRGSQRHGGRGTNGFRYLSISTCQREKSTFLNIEIDWGVFYARNGLLRVRSQTHPLGLCIW